MRIHLGRPLRLASITVTVPPLAKRGRPTFRHMRIRTLFGISIAEKWFFGYLAVNPPTDEK